MRSSQGWSTKRAGATKGSVLSVLVVGLALLMVMNACSPPAASPSSSSGVASAVEGDAARGSIPQPDVGTLQVASPETRVDLAMPTFSDPTSINNPLFPVSEQKSVLLLGKVDGKPFRTEVTLMPETRIIEWDGQQIEALVSQYAAFLGGEIHEVAYDFYAQADDGSVWYLGEDVYNFANGSIVDTHGTWIAGKDGPGAMIMPADPQVGDTYRPENIPGFVFEEVTVADVESTVDGPLGPIDGALLIRELHMDGTSEDKTFAPGYGEFYTAGGGDVEALALAIDADAATSEPEQLQALLDGTAEVFAAAGRKDWARTRAIVADLRAAWQSYPVAEVPRLIGPQIRRSLQTLTRAVDGKDEAGARAAALDVSRSALDLALRTRPTIDVESERFRLAADQLEVDAQAGDHPAVLGDLFVLDYVRDRLIGGVSAERMTQINAQLEELQSAVSDGDLQSAGDMAATIAKG